MPRPPHRFWGLNFLGRLIDRPETNEHALAAVMDLDNVSGREHQRAAGGYTLCGRCSSAVGPRARADLAVIQKAGPPGRLPVAVDEGIIRHLRLVLTCMRPVARKRLNYPNKRSGLPYEHPIGLRAPP